MKKPETVFKEWFLGKINEIPFSWFVKVSLPSIIGIPDILGVIRGKFIAIELKRSQKEKPTSMQIYMLDRIRACGGVAIVAFPENKEIVLEALWAISG